MTKPENMARMRSCRTCNRLKLPSHPIVHSIFQRPITPQLPSVIKRSLPFPDPIQCNQLDTTLVPTPPQGITVISSIGNNALWPHAWSSATARRTRTFCKVASAKVTSCGEADARRIPTGIPWPSASTMHFFPLQSPPHRGNLSQKEAVNSQLRANSNLNQRGARILLQSMQARRSCITIIRSPCC